MIREIGVISDTHGLLRDRALKALAGVDHVIHAGDVGDPEILVVLKEIAPVTAVRGNVDTDDWANELPPTETVQVGHALFHVLHDLQDLDLDPWEAGCQAVIFGHTHKPVSEIRKGVLFLNPGSAGPKRFSLPITLARLVLNGSEIHAEFIDLSGE